MNEQDEIKALQQELDELKQQFTLQHRKIVELQQRLYQLSGKEFKEPVAKPQWSLENFIGLRLIHFIGIVVLVIGLSIGVKYAIDKDLISEGLRIALAYAAGLILYLISVRLKNKYQLFSAILFSGGLASLYFTTYAAHVYYGMFPFAVAFILMVLLTIYSVYEAMSYNRQEIALLGLIGAYGIPFLISKNADRADLFFLYITIINIGVIFLCIKKLWKNVGIVAQSITWLLFIGWASMLSDMSYQLTGLLFMIVFFSIFQFAVLSFKFIRKKALTVSNAYQIVMNNAAMYVACFFVFGFTLDSEDDFGLITLFFSVFVALQSILIRYYWKDENFLVRWLASVALTLFVLFIALNWDGFTVTLLWLLTSVIVFGWGIKVRSVSSRMTAIVLMGITLGKLLVFDSLTFSTVQKVIAYLVLGVLLLVVSFFYQKFKQQLFEKK